MKLLLDSCTFLWLALDPGKLSPLAVRFIDDESNELFLSHVSLWEITLKHTAGKLHLPAPPATWLPTRCEFHCLIPLPIGEPAILLTAVLPLAHADPFDRLLAAQAMHHNLTILSPDQPLSQLGARREW